MNKETTEETINSEEEWKVGTTISFDYCENGLDPIAAAYDALAEWKWSCGDSECVCSEGRDCTNQIEDKDLEYIDKLEEYEEDQLNLHLQKGEGVQ